MWEQQAQGALQQLDSLKDILEESAAWSGALPCLWQRFMLCSLTMLLCYRASDCLVAHLMAVLSCIWAPRGSDVCGLRVDAWSALC